MEPNRKRMSQPSSNNAQWEFTAAVEFYLPALLGLSGHKVEVLAENEEILMQGNLLNQVHYWQVSANEKVVPLPKYRLFSGLLENHVGLCLPDQSYRLIIQAMLLFRAGTSSAVCCVLYRIVEGLYPLFSLDLTEVAWNPAE
ncbi:hypothetical protein GDO86_003586 [Hymenochirus boettgeri]|uniref:Uncharacterized protein n=1 Tax=Hymenochirus boettgeri TaxID=247094 RepID=A0A8T2K5L2_9PIPI|nr:hypothetical protein GDO86_003586 [Hymenochirus boettgeri]